MLMVPAQPPTLNSKLVNTTTNAFLVGQAARNRPSPTWSHAQLQPVVPGSPSTSLPTSSTNCAAYLIRPRSLSSVTVFNKRTTGAPLCLSERIKHDFGIQLSPTLTIANKRLAKFPSHDCMADTSTSAAPISPIPQPNLSFARKYSRNY